MDAEKNTAEDFIWEHIEDSFLEFDGSLCAELRELDSDYAKKWNEAAALRQIFPVIPQITDEGGGAVSLSDGERAAFWRHLRLKDEMERTERKHLYFRGFLDCLVFLHELKNS